MWVLRISTDSFGGNREILKGSTPEAHGVFTDDLNRARQQLASAFEQKSSGMGPLAPNTDIFGALWRVKVLFESEAEPKQTASASRTIWIFSDMVNETRDFSIRELADLGAERMLEEAKAAGLVVPLKGYRICIYGASMNGLSPKGWNTIREFWTNYFRASGAVLISYSADTNIER